MTNAPLFERYRPSVWSDVVGQDKAVSQVRNSAFVYGITSVYAMIENVGGHTSRHCHIRLPQSPRKMIVCGVDNIDLIRRLGQHMYEHVILTGSAKWLRHNWRLKRLEISDFSLPKKGSIRETLNRMSELGGGAWDQIEDPDAFIADSRRM